MRKALDWMAIGALVVAPAVQAQSQPTPENAHRFLMAFLPGKFAGRGSAEDLQIEAVESSGCRTNFSTSGRTATFTIDFSKAEAAKLVAFSDSGKAELQFGSGLTYREANGVSGALPQFGFRFQSAESAQRVQNAFEVLRQACDPTRGLGF